MDAPFLWRRYEPESGQAVVRRRVKGRGQGGGFAQGIPRVFRVFQVELRVGKQDCQDGRRFIRIPRPACVPDAGQDLQAPARDFLHGRVVLPGAEHSPEADHTAP